jgi:hypothetical protein
MADPLDDLLPFRSNYLLSSLPHLHERVIRDPSKPSGVRVLGRSLFVLAAGWTAAVLWLWIEALQQHVWLFGAPPSLYGVHGIIVRLLPAITLALAGWMVGRVVGSAPYRELEWREWRHACGWALVPNALVLSTAWIILNAEL